MIQSGGFHVLNLINSAEVAYKTTSKAEAISNKVSLDYVIKPADISRKILPGLKKIWNRKNKKSTKEQKGGFLGMLIGTLTSSLIGW